PPAARFHPENRPAPGSLDRGHAQRAARLFWPDGEYRSAGAKPCRWRRDLHHRGSLRRARCGGNYCAIPGGKERGGTQGRQQDHASLSSHPNGILVGASADGAAKLCANPAPAERLLLALNDIVILPMNVRV